MQPTNSDSRFKNARKRAPGTSRELMKRVKKPSYSKPAEVEFTPVNCHAREMLVRIGDKWSVYVIHVLGDAGTLRFNEIKNRVDGVSQRMLTVTLRGLER